MSCALLEVSESTLDNALWKVEYQPDFLHRQIIVVVKQENISTGLILLLDKLTELTGFETTHIYDLHVVR